LTKEISDSQIQLTNSIRSSEHAKREIGQTLDGNVLDSICVNCEFDSNEIGVNDLQPENDDDPRISTLRGITIDQIDGRDNAWNPIRVNCEFNSNEIDESDLQIEKQTDPRIARGCEIRIG
jgi:hypothetical protein